LFLVEYETNLFVGQFGVDSSEGVSASLHVGLVLGVKVNFKDALSVNLAANTLSGDFGGVDNVLKDGVLNSGEGTGARTKTGGLLGTSVAVSKDGALSNNQNVTSRELLLKLTNKTLVDLVVALKKLVRNVKDDSLTSTSNIDLLGGSYVKITKRCLQFGGSHLQVQKFLSHIGLKIICLLYQ
jgi:hypothetical protein